MARPHLPSSSAADVVRAKTAIVFDLYDTLTAVESGWGGGLPSTSQMLGLSHEAWDGQLLEHSCERQLGEAGDLA